MVKLSDYTPDKRDAERRAIALKIVGLSDRGEITLDAVERLLIAYDAIKQGQDLCSADDVGE